MDGILNCFQGWALFLVCHFMFVFFLLLPLVLLLPRLFSYLILLLGVIFSFGFYFHTGLHILVHCWAYLRPRTHSFAVLPFQVPFQYQSLRFLYLHHFDILRRGLVLQSVPSPVLALALFFGPPCSTGLGFYSSSLSSTTPFSFLHHSLATFFTSYYELWLIKHDVTVDTRCYYSVHCYLPLFICHLNSFV